MTRREEMILFVKVLIAWALFIWVFVYIIAPFITDLYVHLQILEKR